MIRDVLRAGQSIGKRRSSKNYPTRSKHETDTCHSRSNGLLKLLYLVGNKKELSPSSLGAKFRSSERFAEWVLRAGPAL
jgi:hypothetical protein